jgi:hypothetical protein
MDIRYMEGDVEKRAAVFIGPEFGTVQRADLVAAVGAQTLEAPFFMSADAYDGIFSTE